MLSSIMLDVFNVGLIPFRLAVLQRPNSCLNSTLLTTKLDNCERSELQSEAVMEDQQTCQ